MKVLIVSDVHNQWDKLARAIEIGHEHQCETLLFAGDAHEPHIYAELCAFKGAIHVVWGNNDVPHFVFQAALLLHPRVTNHGDLMTETIGGLRIFMTHYPAVVTTQIQKDMNAHDVLIHGHDHKQRAERVASALVINPGECCGTRYGIPSCAVLDTETRSVTFHTLSV
jgi:uncharacterized protein